MSWITGEEFKVRGGNPDEFVSSNGLYDEAWLDPITGFFAHWNGKFIDFDHAWGYQCVDSMRQFVQDVDKLTGYNHDLPAVDYAKNIFLKFPTNGIYFDKVYNGKYNYPKRGDLVFFKTSVWFPFLFGKAGHVGIVDYADVNTMILFNQNYPTGSACSYRKFGYKDCLGWLTKKS